MRLSIDLLQATPGGGLSANRLSVYRSVTVGGVSCRAPYVYERERVAPDMTLDVAQGAAGAWRLLCYSRPFTGHGGHVSAGGGTGDGDGGRILVSVAAPGLTIVDATMWYSPEISSRLLNAGAYSCAFHFRTAVDDPFQIVVGWVLAGAWVRPDGSGRVFGVRLESVR